MNLSLSMPLTFNSKQIDKVVSIDDVASLSNPEILFFVKIAIFGDFGIFRADRQNREL